MKPGNTEKQLIDALREAGTGAEVPAPGGDPADRKLPEGKYLQHLEDENRRLKLAVADLTLRNQALTLVVTKKW